MSDLSDLESMEMEALSSAFAEWAPSEEFASHEYRKGPRPTKLAAFLSLALLCTGCSLAVAKLFVSPDLDSADVDNTVSAVLDPGQHCCNAPVESDVWNQDSVMALTCDWDNDDAIVAVPFAKFSEPAADWQCGSERGPDCLQGVQRKIEENCLGKKTCTLIVKKFLASLLEEGEITDSGSCRDTSRLHLRLRWECRSDTVASEKGTAQLPPLPLRARGNVLIDANGERFRLQGINWAGAHITGVPDGLDRAPVRQLARLVSKLGFNVVRLTFSMKAILEDKVVDDRLVGANPNLKGLTSLQVFDAVIDALKAEGVLVFIDNHMLDNDWCCDRQDCNGFWFNACQSEDDWIAGWRVMAKRYADVKNVVGAGIKNEPRSVCGGNGWGGAGKFCNATTLDPDAKPMDCVEMAWGSGPQRLDWHAAASRVGKAIQEVNSYILISVGGREYGGDLSGFAKVPDGVDSSRLVYEAHEYSWFGFVRFAGQRWSEPVEGYESAVKEGDAKRVCSQLGANCSGLTCDASDAVRSCKLGRGRLLEDPRGVAFRKQYTYSPGEASFEDYARQHDEWWGYLLRESVAPVWLSETGFGHDEYASGWFRNLRRYVLDEGPLAEKGGLDWAYWQFAGVQSGGTSRTLGGTESYGVLNRCWTGAASDKHMGAIQSLMTKNPGDGS
eukprot:TRINITY_DN17756_c0_g1_i1.p1 TRINITY_DN17756_c0_g1~~TRINITY_DN17756_c0_g1_i1.p1  ORF type:complete len:670 (+),score=110.83 TRINITY_DN17756_c0_g1_i1:139-2148(+)